MTIRVFCNNCEREIRNSDDPKKEPEKRVTLVMAVEGTGSRPLDWDLCVPCAQKIVRRLKEPL